jgi:hypothetical protein
MVRSIVSEQTDGVNQVYGKWVATNMDPIGMAAVNMLSVGVVVMLLWLDCWCCTIDI